uniref:helix-turn-helix domain-containing protein n=1 Tax=Desulfobacter sp. TaxID=2294 RepID=UPI00257B1582
ILPESLTISSHKRRRWIEGIQNNRYDLEDVVSGVDLDKIMSEIESAYVKKAMELCQGNKSKAAELLTLSLRSFRYRLDKTITDKNESGDGDAG